MIKIFSIIALIVLSQSAFLAESETELQSPFDNIIKCIQEVKPVIAEIPELFKAIKALDLKKSIEVINTIIADGKIAFQNCIKLFFGKDTLLGDSLPQWVINLIYQYGRSILNMITKLGLEKYQALIAAFVFRHGM